MGVAKVCTSALLISALVIPLATSSLLLLLLLLVACYFCPYETSLQLLLLHWEGDVRLHIVESYCYK